MLNVSVVDDRPNGATLWSP